MKKINEKSLNDWVLLNNNSKNIIELDFTAHEIDLFWAVISFIKNYESNKDFYIPAEELRYRAFLNTRTTFKKYLETLKTLIKKVDKNIYDYEENVFVSLFNKFEFDKNFLVINFSDNADKYFKYSKNQYSKIRLSLLTKCKTRSQKRLYRRLAPFIKEGKESFVKMTAETFINFCFKEGSLEYIENLNTRDFKRKYFDRTLSRVTSILGQTALEYTKSIFNNVLEDKITIFIKPLTKEQFNFLAKKKRDKELMKILPNSNTIVTKYNEIDDKLILELADINELDSNITYSTIETKNTTEIKDIIIDEIEEIESMDIKENPAFNEDSEIYKNNDFVIFSGGENDYLLVEDRTETTLEEAFEEHCEAIKQNKTSMRSFFTDIGIGKNKSLLNVNLDSIKLTDSIDIQKDKLKNLIYSKILPEEKIEKILLKNKDLLEHFGHPFEYFGARTHLDFRVSNTDELTIFKTFIGKYLTELSIDKWKSIIRNKHLNIFDLYVEYIREFYDYLKNIENRKELYEIIINNKYLNHEKELIEKIYVRNMVNFEKI